MANHLSVQEICSILEVSAKTGVAELTYGSMHVRFGRPAEPEQSGMPQVPAPYPVTVLTEAQHVAQNKASLEQAELETREDQLSRLQLENPFEAEQMVMAGELDESDIPDDEE